MAVTRLMDEAHFRLMTGEDRDLQIEVLGLFRAQAELWRRLLIPDAPIDTWREAAHTLKGSARSLGLWALAEDCERAEALAKANEPDRPLVGVQLARVRASLAAALAEIEHNLTPA